MNAKRVFFMMVGGLSLSLIALGVLVYMGNKLLVKESGKLLELKAISQVLEIQATGLTQAQQDVQKYSDLETITQAVVPQDKDQARAVREIVELARQSGIELKSVTFPASNLGNTTKPTTSSGGQSTTQAKPAAGLSQSKPVEGIKGVYSIELSIEPVGEVNYYKFLEFLAKLEKNRRTSQVSRIKIDQPADKNSQNIDFSLTINIFVKP